MDSSSNPTPPAGGASNTNANAASTSTSATEHRPKLTPTPKPVPTTLSGKLRAKLPSRGWMIFWGTVGTLGALVTRDHYLTVDAKKRVADKVDVLAKQTCDVQEMPRKVTVYIMPPPGDGIHKTRHYFKQFVKPVFDAAALDYEVKEGLTEGQIQAMVAADIRKKRQIAAGKKSALAKEEQNAPVIPLKSISDGIVVLGRVALGEVLKGYNDGCLQSLDDPEPAVATEVVKEVLPSDEVASLTKEATGSVESTADYGTTEDSASLSSTITTETVDELTEGSSSSSLLSSSTLTPSSSLSPEAASAVAKAAEAAAADVAKTAAAAVPIPQDEAYFSVPPSGLEPVGYIPFKNLTGFRNFHKKLFALFNSYDCVEYAGAAVMKVAFAETKDMEKADLELGRDEEPLFRKYRGPVEIELLDRVRENVKLFVTPERLPELKKTDEMKEE